MSNPLIILEISDFWNECSSSLKATQVINFALVTKPILFRGAGLK